MKKEIFNENDWSGTYFELAIQFKDTLPNDILIDCIQALWSNNQIYGPWHTKEDLYNEKAKIKSLAHNVYSSDLYGVLTLQDSTSLGCLSLTVREENASDWLLFCIPLGMLDKNFPLQYPLQYPYIPEHNFLIEIEMLFSQLAKTVFETHPFDLALVGEEVSGTLYAETLTNADVENGGVIIPKKSLK